MILTFLLLAEVISNYIRLEVAEIRDLIRHDDTGEGERDEELEVGHSDEGSSDENSNNLITAADELLQNSDEEADNGSSSNSEFALMERPEEEDDTEELEDGYIVADERGHVDVVGEDPTHLEVLRSQIAERVNERLPNGLETAIEQVVELAECFRNDGRSDLCHQHIRALVQYYIDHPLRIEEERAPEANIPFMPKLSSNPADVGPNEARERVKRLVNEALRFYCHQFRRELEDISVQEAVRDVLNLYLGCVGDIYKQCLRIQLHLEGDLQLAYLLANLKSITKRVGSLVSAQTEGKVRDLIKGRQLTKEVEDILTTVMSAVSKEVEVLMSINKQQMKNFLNKKRAGVDLTLVAFSPCLRKIHRARGEKVNKFLTTFQSHPHTHRSLLQVLSSEQIRLQESPGEEDEGAEEPGNELIVVNVRGHADVAGEDPTHLEVLLCQIQERSYQPLPNGFEAAIDQVVELAECFKNDGRSDLCLQHIRALVQYYIDHPLRFEARVQQEPIPFFSELSSNPADVGPNEARERVKRLVNEALHFYCHQFRSDLEDISVQAAVREVLNLYLGCVGDIYEQCLRVQLVPEEDLQLAYLLTNLKSITKRVGSLVSAHTEGKVSDLIKGRQLTKEVKDILTTVMFAVSKEVEVLMSINKKQMKSLQNKERAGVDLTIVAFSPRLTEIERTNREKVSKFLTTFQSHPHTHRALLKLFISEQEKAAEVVRGMYPCLHWLTRISESCLQLGGWRDHLQAHGLANFCATADPENLLLIENVYNIESAAYDGQHPLTFSEYQKLTNQLKQQLWEYREETRLSFKALETVEQSLDVGDIFSQTSTEKALNFSSQVISASKVCSEGFVKFTSSVIESSVQVLNNSGLSPPCSFAVIDLGNVARGEATPYSTLKYAFVVENESNMEYFPKLAMQTYFLITNMGETPLQHFGLDHLSDIGMVVADGYRIDGITNLSGSIPTGNGLVNGKSLILSVEGFVKLFEEESVTPSVNSLDILSAPTLLYAHHEGEDLYRRFVKERLAVEKELQNNPLASETKLQQMSAVLDHCQLFPHLRYTPSHCQPVKSMKAETLRYLALLAESLQSFLALEVHYPWETWAMLNEKGALSDLPHSYIKIALAMSIYIRTCSSLYLKSQSDQLVLSITSSSTSSDTSSATPSAPTEQTDRYSIQRSSYILLSSILLHAERFVRSELAKGYNELSALVNKFSLPKPSPLLKAEVHLSLGDYKFSLNQVHEVVEKRFVNSGCETFVDAVSEKLNKDEGHADVRRYTELCACLLYLTQQYPGALNYSHWLVSHKTSELDGLEWKVVSAQCLRAGGSYQPACDHLLEVILGVKEYLDMKQKENSSVQVLQTLRFETGIGKRKLMLFEVTATAYAVLGIVYKDMTKDTEAEEYTLSGVLLFHSLMKCNTGSKYRLWGLMKYLESITQEASQDISGCLEELYVNEPDHRACDRLAMMCYKSEHFTKALKYWKMSLEKLHAEHTNNAKIAADYHQIGRVLYRQNHYTLSLQHQIKSLKMMKELHGSDTNHREIAMCYNWIGDAYNALREHTLALEYQIKSLDMRKALYGAKTNHREIANSYNEVGNAYYSMGKYTEALDYYIKSVVMDKSLFGADANRTNLATTYSNMGVAYHSLGQLELAIEYCNRSVVIRKSLFGADANRTDIATSYFNIGVVYKSLGQLESAMKYHIKSLEMRRAVYGETTNHVAIAYSYKNIGHVYRGLRMYTTALEYYTKCLAMRKAIYSDAPNQTKYGIAISYYNIGNTYSLMGQHAVAYKFLELSIQTSPANDESADIDISVTAASCCLHMKLWHKCWLYLYSALNRCLSLPQSQRQLFLTAKVHYYISLLLLHLGLTSLSLEHSLFSLNLSCVPLANKENVTPEYVELIQDVQALTASLELVRDCWTQFGGL